MFRPTVLASLAIFTISAMVASPAVAGGGGGGTKGRNGTLRILGAQSNVFTVASVLALPAPPIGVGVIPVPNGTTTVPSYPSIAAFQAAGGVIVNPGQVCQFKVGGPGRAVAYYVDTDNSLGASSEAPYSGAQNQTGYLKIIGSAYEPIIEGTGEKF